MASLPHILPAVAYTSAAQHERDVAALRRGWHCVGTGQDYAQLHDYRTFDVMGTGVIVHRTPAGLRAFVNACAHRHTALTLAAQGHREHLQCQYHGWEYDAVGVACRIPDAACFMPFKYGDFRLEALRVEALGDLQFITLDPDCQPLAASLPTEIVSRIARAFSPTRKQILSLSINHPCNWKIPIENVLEDYHVAMLHQHFVARHPRLFKFFQGRPPVGEERYELQAGYTSVKDELGGDSALYRRAINWVRSGAEPAFIHTHVFPNLLLGESGVVGFFQQVFPVSESTSRSLVRMTMDVPARGGALGDLALHAGKRLARLLFDQLMREDGRVFPAVQHGKRSTSDDGRLSSAERRIHAFHCWLQNRGLLSPDSNG